MPDKTSLIIPVYSTTDESVEMMQACMASLRYGRPDEVIIVDDGSPIYRTFGADIQLQLPTNQGYTKAVNAGFKTAHGDILIIGNSDLLFQPGWLEGILKPLQEGYEVASIVTSDQGWGMEAKITSGDRFGALFAMRRVVYATVGGFDTAFRNYFGDTDLHMRANRAGFKIGKNWGAAVEHKGGGTLNVVPGANDFETGKEVFRERYGFII